MKSSPFPQSRHPLALLLAAFAVSLTATLTCLAAPSLQPLLQGKWPAWPRGYAMDVKVVGDYAYIVLGVGSLAVIDISDPANCVRVGGYDTRGTAYGVAVVAGRIYVADGYHGLVVLPTLRDFQFTVRVEATPGVPFALEAATDLSAPFPWTPLLTTNLPTMPFDFVDYDVKLSDKPHKFYRVRQP